MNAKTIPLQDVQAALMCAIVRLKTQRLGMPRHGRTAAYTQAPFWQPTCKDALRARRLASSHRHKVLRQHFSPMHMGDMDRVLERTRLERGLQEVRRTWGAGYRALVAEFGRCTIMR